MPVLDSVDCEEAGVQEFWETEDEGATVAADWVHMMNEESMDESREYSTDEYRQMKTANEDG